MASAGVQLDKVSAKAHRPRPLAPLRSRPRWLQRVAPLLHQARRALAEPERLSKLHYSSLLAALHAVVEPDEGALLRRWFGPDVAIEPLERDLLGDRDFVQAIESVHRDGRGREIRLLGSTSAGDHERGCRLLYYLTRLLRPAVVVETGVFDGFSSAFLLKALRDNDCGRLHSIDVAARTPIAASTDRMPNATLPAGRPPGWIVPSALHERWTLHLGPSAEVLPALLEDLHAVDLFLHDSLHTDENMYAEFASAWPKIPAGGLLVSDDIFWNRAFWRFQAERGVTGEIFRGLGILSKPPAAPGEGTAGGLRA